MRILYVSSEVVPFAKTGGLADVAGALPKALKEIGHDIRIVMPRYKQLTTNNLQLTTKIKVNIASETLNVNIYETKLPRTAVTVYFVDNEKYFGSRQELYQVKGQDYPDNLERFTLFCQSVIKLVLEIKWQPDIIHCNDWQSALVIAYLKVLYKDEPFFKRTAALYSTHNIGYMGTFAKEKLPLTGLGWDQYTSDKLEFWGNIALTKAGFVYADIINTVSETYAKEIQTPEYGCGLDGLLRVRSQDVYGVINGLDYDLWNPAKDPMIPKKYSAATLSLKLDNKIALQKQNNLPQDKDIPVIGLIARLADQKGLDILAGVLDQVMNLKCQLIVLGTGDLKYHDLLKQAKVKYPEHIGLNLGFDSALAQLIYAGSDMFLMPSRYEPCGLGQLISFKYGTIPIVRKTGGLADTVHNFDPKTGEGDGFVFSGYASLDLLDAIKRAISTYQNQRVWQKLQQKVMAYDYSWTASAKKYVGLYVKALAKIGIKAL